MSINVHVYHQHSNKNILKGYTFWLQHSPYLGWSMLFVAHRVYLPLRQDLSGLSMLKQKKPITEHCFRVQQR